MCGGGNAEDGLEYAEAMRKVNPSMQCLTISVKEQDFYDHSPDEKRASCWVGIAISKG